jgi:VWFA-related protein
MYPRPVKRRLLFVLAAAAFWVASLNGQQPASPQGPPGSPGPPSDERDSFLFKSGIELVNVTATVSDSSGRFVSGLTKDDFIVYEDDQPVEVAQFSPERVPVSLGIVLDTSGSMAGMKIQEAESALDRFLFDLLDPGDEIFLYRFSNYPMLLQGWTEDRKALSRALGHIVPSGGTAMYDTIGEAIPMAQRGKHLKKALLVISDGNDTTSRTSVREVKQRIRESEVLVYAVGIDGDGRLPTFRQPPPQPPRMPFPFPPRRGRGGFQIFGPGVGQRSMSRGDDRVNVGALRELTDDSGGRTEVVRDPRDLNPATANIADELRKQYYLAYPAIAKKDGRWHTIRVETRNQSYRVRARRGYIAS